MKQQRYRDVSLCTEMQEEVCVCVCWGSTAAAMKVLHYTGACFVFDSCSVSGVMWSLSVQPDHRSSEVTVQQSRFSCTMSHKGQGRSLKSTGPPRPASASSRLMMTAMAASSLLGLLEPGSSMMSMLRCELSPTEQEKEWQIYQNSISTPPLCRFSL